MRSFLATAMRATLPGFPAALSFWKKVLRIELWRMELKLSPSPWATAQKQAMRNSISACAGLVTERPQCIRASAITPCGLSCRQSGQFLFLTAWYPMEP